MRLLTLPAFAVVFALLSGCASAPNQPTLILQTSKAPDEYVQCVMPKLQEHSLNPVLSQSQRHYRIVVSSPVAADNVIEAYKAPAGGKVFLYERQLLASTLITSRFERAAQECL
ncbi:MULTISPECIES: hypothetical protein [Pseudomonas]|nr:MULTISPECIES: hypothetical protein [Pseudomonas]QVE19617.1 hypothetical protein KGD89_07580 [Pseudomonas cichorii]GFM74470.1 hypothetical protein PSCICM_02890 [Pseudomonas cichorii]GFM91679.1 hypothetical protein PSCICP_16510 [Pseudomonas cichorii]SDO07382.1 hypothetical protein SAMN05216599_105215 [Pseudomonas cichorii]